MKQYSLLLFILFSVVFGSYAQDAQPETTLTNEDFYTWSETLFFPQQVNFLLLTKRRESNIAELDLIVRHGGESFPITIDPTTVITTPNGGLIEYTWIIPGDPLPRLFQPIRYQWNITTVEGRVFNLAGDFVFEDTRIEWQLSNDLSAQVNINYGRGQVDPNRVRQGIRETYNLLFEDLDNQPTYNLVVYPSNVPVGCATNQEGDPIIRIPTTEGIETVECNLDFAYRIFDDSDYMVFSESSVDLIQQTLIKLLVETYYLEQWGASDVPDWFLSGLQQFYDPRPKTEMLVLAQKESRLGDLLSLDELAIQPEDEDKLALWEAQSVGLVIYLADKIGVDALFDFADSLNQYDSFEEAYDDVVNQDLDLLLLSWQDWLFLSSSEADYQYQPYLPDTATPTVTATVTQTPTPTFTPSITPDITSTPRPTFTRIPPPSTTTPLPAQSFSVQPTDAPPTPIPNNLSDNNIQTDDGFVTRVAIGGSVISVLLILLFIVLRKR